MMIKQHIPMTAAKTHT